MNIPIPPTDNIYKYCAIVGTLIVIFSLYVPYLIMKEYREKSSSINLKIASINAEQYIFEIRIKALEELTENGILLQKNKFRFDTAKFNIPYSWNEIKKMKEQLLELDKSVHINIAELTVFNEDLKQLAIDYERISNITDRLFYFGIIIGVVGYILWYYRIQRYQDKALKLSVEK
jgi:hypothetical protein